jgi:hypothetical protein
LCAMRKFRRGASFWARAQCVTKLDRNDKARIIYLAERTELRTKGRGRKAGAIGQSGLQVLRCLLHQFHSTATGQCDPSYTAIQARTGFCRQVVADALRRLEDTGMICVMRRLIRDGWRVIQATNAYVFPASTPVHSPSLVNREKPPVQIIFPYKRPHTQLSLPLSQALEALAERIAAKEACS